MSVILIVLTAVWVYVACHCCKHVHCLHVNFDVYIDVARCLQCIKHCIYNYKFISWDNSDHRFMTSFLSSVAFAEVICAHLCGGEEKRSSETVLFASVCIPQMFLFICTDIWIAACLGRLASRMTSTVLGGMLNSAYSLALTCSRPHA